MGAWSTEGLMSGKNLKDSQASYTTMLYFNEDGANNQVYSQYGMPDVFDESWKASISPLAQQWCESRTDDPYCIGYFLGNEMHWDKNGWRRINGNQFEILDAYLMLDANSAGRLKAKEFLSSKGKIATELSEMEKWEFAAIVADEFFKTTTAAVRQYDTNHMILGTRFAGYAQEHVLNAAKNYVDVISLNAYELNPNTKVIEHMERVSQKPVLLTEFGFRTRLEENNQPWGGNTKVTGPIVETQQDKIKELEEHFDISSRNYAVIGAHVFEYSNQPVKGRKGDGENSNYGFVNVKDEPYMSVVTHISKIMPTLEKRRIGKL